MSRSRPSNHLRISYYMINCCSHKTSFPLANSLDCRSRVRICASCCSTFPSGDISKSDIFLRLNCLVLSMTAYLGTLVDVLSVKNRESWSDCCFLVGMFENVRYY
ncbi:hypothetical protein PHLGIDRAFT_456143 [Phlebiopsis gigantea 11061_1 CR5-6]|uniref:Uncharacterized protein n=1 Tax=Phlebiopsis gigantea (strain 11061_1 CR5-6) TaxID=745531 RepID=A0A0C3SD71_PHLG1|nr:hypothetical protein PHLGIDRAFT_456143 [Phlebiopsis gigantea 11061_1 CR5-6]